MDIADQSVIVTGGASGLGLATAKRIAARGGKVTIFARNQAAGQAAAEATGGLFAKVDITDEDSVAKGLAAAEAAHGAPRILINCAGVGPAARTIGKDNKPHALSSFRDTIETNLIGAFNVLSKFAARLASLEALGEERGVIINTASVAVWDAQVGQAAYAASKGGVVSMTLPIARDLAPHKIRVMTIAPGIFLTPMLTALPQPIQDGLAAQIPHPQRLGDPDEFADLVEAIVRNPMLNGEVIRIDGGLRLAAR